MSHHQGTQPDPYGPEDPYGPGAHGPGAYGPGAYGPGGGVTDRRAGGPGRRTGGVPDALVVGSLGFAISVTLLVWSSTGLAGLLHQGSWPSGVAFPRTAGAIRSFLTAPGDVAAAWPHADPAALPGAGLLWLMFLAQLAVAFATVLWVAIRVGRWRGRRARGGAGPGQRPSGARAAPNAPDRGYPHPGGPAPDHDHPTGSLTGTTSATGAAGEARDAAGAVLAAGPAAAVADPDGRLYRSTAARRADHGRVHLYDPDHLTDTPVRLRWAPHHGCADLTTARRRAAALLAPVRPSAPVFQLDAETAETVLRGYLHAAAITGRPFGDVHRWAQSNAPEPARTLRAHPRAAPGASMELEAALTAHPGRRDSALALINRALAGLERPAVSQACAPGKADTAALEDLLESGGTLYVVGDAAVTAPLRHALLDAVAPRLDRVDTRRFAH
ncbi:hypothetical protein [Streptomyces otsuchiensis]|uniref:hypothetical protein n=1 Tax=Streptomyces otsuchiensis TaxID=2681388 RepID=UPI00103111F3|nr:hypothetical protein [Streptomyces otsuchiensis]